MSIKKESMKKQKNLLSIEMRKELNLLPNIIKEKKAEKEIIYKETLKAKEKINITKKELNKASVNILNLEKDYSSLMLKNDKIKTNQKILLNSINNEIIQNNILIKNNIKDDVKELFYIFFNFENEFKEELSDFLFSDNIEITKLLIGAYAYLKMLQKDIPLKYKQIRNKILDIINKTNKETEEDIYKLILLYIENIFTMLDNKEKNNIFKQKHESMTKKKNEIFIKLKLIEEQRKGKEEKLNLISSFIKELQILIEKNKLLLNFPNENEENNNNEKNVNKINNDKNKMISITPNHLNISCPKNTISNELGKPEEKLSIINIDLTNTSLLEKKYYIKSNRKTIESFELKNNKGINTNKYKNIYELEKDINEDYNKIKNNPLYKVKKKFIKKKINNNKNTNTNMNKQNKLPSDKSKEKKKEKISKNNTTMTYNTNNNNIISNINNLINQKDINKSYDSSLNKKEEEIKEGKQIKQLFSCLKKENGKIIKMKPSSNSTTKKKKEEKKNDIEEGDKEKTNLLLKENETLKNNEYINIIHNNTILMKKNSLNKIKTNKNKKDFDTQISLNTNQNRKNSPENINSSFLKNIKENNLNKNKVVILDKNEIKNKYKSPNNNSIINNNSNKNCHIIPFKKYKINYIKDKNINNKKNKNLIKINTNNYNSDKLKGNNIRKNYLANSQIIKSFPKDEFNKNNKKSFIKI